MDAIEPLNTKQKMQLLRIARDAISAQVLRGSVPALELDDAALNRDSGVFVTLEEEGRLRGCIGSLEADRPLHRQVAHMAVTAAMEDHRFTPLAPSDLMYVEIEISVLSPMTPITPEEIEIGLHGLYVAQGRKRGVFLPQVPVQYGWDVSQYLKELLSKGGLDPGAYDDPQTRLFGFTADVFSEGDLQREEPEGPY